MDQRTKEMPSLTIGARLGVQAGGDPDDVECMVVAERDGDLVRLEGCAEFAGWHSASDLAQAIEESV